MRINVLFACVAMVFMTIGESMAQSLPSMAMGKPKIFLNEEESWQWEDIASSRNWGELSNNPWKVYIDREGVKAYAQSSSSSSVRTVCHFMDYYYVAKVENGYALLFSQSVKSLTIAPDASVCGWVSVDELLLWTVCPRTLNQVYKKALIVKDIESGDYSNEKNPYFYKSPTGNEENGFRATELQIYFVFKEKAKSALMFLGRSLDDNILTKRHGWMRRAEYTNWNERLCFEPNFGDEVKGSVAAIFDDQAKARTYKNSGLGGEKPVWKEQSPASRWPANYMRFPVLEINSQYIAQVATINTFTSGSNVSTKKWSEIQSKLEAVDDKLRTVNVVFVVDGTASMKEYFRPMAMAISRAMQHESMSDKKVNFGAVVYRNYADEKGGKFELVEKKALSSNFNSVAEWLVARSCGSAELKDSYEAMYYGLDQAADMFRDGRTCNFVILVGDAASKEPDVKGLTTEKIAEKFAKKEVNFVAFQVNHILKDAYDDYSSQVTRIMLTELQTLRGQKVARQDFQMKNNLLEYVYDKGWPVVSAGYRFADPGKSEAATSLEALIENKILDFTKLAMKNKENFNRALDELMGGGREEGSPTGREVTKDVEEYLLSQGMTREEIEVLKNKGTSIKLKGYTSRMAGGKEVFTSSVFMSQFELRLLINSLESLSKNTTGNPRKDLQDALKRLALIYIGQIENPDDIEIDAMMQAMNGIGKGMGRSPLSGINIKQLTNPNVVSETRINDFKAMIADDVRRLKQLQSNKSCYFVSNDEYYYYILVDDMPLQGE